MARCARLGGRPEARSRSLRARDRDLRRHQRPNRFVYACVETEATKKARAAALRQRKERTQTHLRHAVTSEVGNRPDLALLQKRWWRSAHAEDRALQRAS